MSDTESWAMAGFKGKTLYAILGVQLFAGALRSRCYDVDTGSGGESFCGGMEECRSRCVNQILNPQQSEIWDSGLSIGD